MLFASSTPPPPTPHPACRPPSPTRGEGFAARPRQNLTPELRLRRLLPLWEKVPEGRMRGLSPPQRSVSAHGKIVPHRPLAPQGRGEAQLGRLRPSEARVRGAISPTCCRNPARHHPRTPHPAYRPPSPTRGEGVAARPRPLHPAPGGRLRRLLPLWDFDPCQRQNRSSARRADEGALSSARYRDIEETYPRGFHPCDSPPRPAHRSEIMTSGWCDGRLGGSGVVPGQAESTSAWASSLVKPLKTQGTSDAGRSRGQGRHA